VKVRGVGGERTMKSSSMGERGWVGGAREWR